MLVRTGHFTPIPHGCKPHMRDIKSYSMLFPTSTPDTTSIALLLTFGSLFWCHQRENFSSR